MSVETISPIAEQFYYHWRLIRDCVAGEKVIKQRGEAYLPRKTGQTKDDYEAYKARAKWADYTEQALNAMHGMIFRRMPSVELPDNEQLKKCFENFDREGHSFYQFASNTCYDNMQTSFGGVILDMPVAGEDIITEFDAEQKGVNRPYCRYYQAENVINWKYSDINGSQKLSLVVLREWIEANESDEFGHDITAQYRVLDLDKDGYYRVRLYRGFSVKKDGKEIIEYAPFGTPISVEINGEKLRYIPFWFLPFKDPTKPMLYGIAELNKHYYMQSADYENGVHFTTLPTAVITGHNNQSEEQLHLGTDVAIMIPEADSRAYTLVFSGEGLTHCEQAIAATQEQIGILGTRAISPDKAMSETADAAKIHRQGENARLATYARDISEVFTKIAQTMADWIKVDGKIIVQFNVDYDTLTFDPNMLNAIANLSREGKFPLPFIYEALVRGEIIPNGFSFKDFMLLLDLEASGISAVEEIQAYQKLRAGENIEIPNLPVNQVKEEDFDNSVQDESLENKEN